MGYPRHQKVLCRTRGRKTQFFYGDKLGDLIKAHLKVGESFGYATLTTSKWRVGERKTRQTYVTEA